MADTEAESCRSAGGVAPPAGEATGPPQYTSNASGTSGTGVAVSLRTAGHFFFEIVVRVMPSAFLVFLLGVLLGGLKNWAAWHLLDKGEAMGWTQPWNETRDSELEGAWGTQTYVEFMNTSAHLYRDGFHDVPKYADHWVIIFYLRNAVESSVGCGVPVFIIWALHGFQSTKRITLICFMPFVITFFVFYLASAYMVINVGRPLVGHLLTQIIVGGLVALQAFVVLPQVGKRLKLTNIWKSVIAPYCVLVISLGALQNLVPIVSEKIKSEWVLVMFRVFGYSFMQEVFVGCVRILQRLVPVSDEAYRPEDKTFSVLPVDCLFGYWGRILLMDLTETGPILAANLAISVGEFLARITVVQRDKLYLRVLWASSKKQSEFWQVNASGMMRFRCSMITTHLFAEYLMIATAAGYYYASGIAPSMTEHIFNCATQFLAELFCDGITLCWEIFIHKLPIVQAWNNRRAYFGVFFGLFAIGFNVFAMSRSANYFCGMKKPDTTWYVTLRYCGAAKG